MHSALVSYQLFLLLKGTYVHFVVLWHSFCTAEFDVAPMFVHSFYNHHTDVIWTSEQMFRKQVRDTITHEDWLSVLCPKISGLSITKQGLIV